MNSILLVAAVSMSIACQSYAQNKSVAVFLIYGPRDNPSTRAAEYEAFRQEILSKMHPLITAAIPDWERIETSVPQVDPRLAAKEGYAFIQYNLGGYWTDDIKTQCSKVFNDIFMKARFQKAHHMWYKCSDSTGFNSLNF